MIGILILFAVLAAAFVIMHKVEKRYDRDTQGAARTFSPVSPAYGTQRHTAITAAVPSVPRPAPAPGLNPESAARLAVIEASIGTMEGALSTLKAELRALQESTLAGEVSPWPASRRDIPSTEQTTVLSGESEEPQRSWQAGRESVPPAAAAMRAETPFMSVPEESGPASAAVYDTAGTAHDTAAAVPGDMSGQAAELSARQDVEESPFQGNPAAFAAGQGRTAAPDAEEARRAGFGEKRRGTFGEGVRRLQRPFRTGDEAAPPQLEPGFLEKAWRSMGELGLTRVLGASNIWVLAGIGLLLVGLVFLVRFAIEHGILGPEARLGVAAAVGLALLATGWRHRETRRELGLILQGGGVGALYLTVVAAVKLYDLLPQPLAFALLVGIVVFSTVIAVIQNARLMAHIAYGAGFLAPILVSKDSGNYVALFSFYILLNLGILGISRFRNWRSLYLTGFVFTAAIGGLWGHDRYEPGLFYSVEAFLVAFFCIFTYLAVAGGRPASFAQQRGKDVFIDAPLTLATPLVFILYQAAMTRGMDFVLAFTSLALGLVYLVIANIMWRSRNAAASEVSWIERTIGRSSPGVSAPSAGLTVDAEALVEIIRKGRTLQAEIYLAFGIVFTNLALPLALYDLGLRDWGDRLLSLIWCLEGASLFWLGRHAAMRLFRVFGLASLGLGFIYTLRYAAHGSPMYLADAALALEFGAGTWLDLGISLVLHAFGAASFAVAALAVHRYALEGEEEKTRTNLRRALLIVGAAWLYGSFLFELASLDYTWEITLLLCAISSCTGDILARRFQWRELTVMSLVSYAPFLVLFAHVAFELVRFLFGNFDVSPGDRWTYRALLLFIVYDLTVLHMPKKSLRPVFEAPRRLGMFNATPLLLTAFTVFAGVSYFGLPATWARALCVAWPCLYVLGGLKKIRPEILGSKHWLIASVLPVSFLAVWFVTNLFVLGNPAPLPYIPILNPLEAALLAAATMLFLWVREARQLLPGNPILAVLGRQAFQVAIIFLLANVTVARSCALWTDMPFTFAGVMRNGTCQGVMAVLWALTGFFAMLRGHKTLQRSLWLTGVFVIMADVAKLFFIDLTRVETLWRIVAFMAVGLLLIIIGYKAPLPPVAGKPGEEGGKAAAEDGSNSTEDSGAHATVADVPKEDI